MSPSPSSESSNQGGFAATLEGTLLVLAERMTVMQRDVSALAIRVDRLASEQATRATITDLSIQIKSTQDQAETRLRLLEDWKTGIGAQIKLAYVLAAVFSSVAGLIGHYWKA